MAFDVTAYHQFIKLLYEHPEWRAEVRQLVLSEEILSLPQLIRNLSATVQELAEAQKRTEERVSRLETAIAELAEAQKRTEERVSRLETAIAELAEAQKRTEQRVEELAEAQKRTDQRVELLAVELQKTRREVAGLAAAIGSTVEEEAGSVAEVVMRRKGYRLLQEAYELRMNGEVDVVLPVVDQQGRRLCVIVEAKARLSRRDVQAWTQRMRSEGWQKRLAKAGYPGPYLVYMYAIRADVGAREALVEAGIGLLKSEGEVFAPTEEIG